MKLRIDCSSDSGPFSHFWNSTGFTPASLLLTPDMRQAVAYNGSVPFGGIVHHRIHYLLELVGLGFDGGAPRYDWSRLDAALDVLVTSGTKPFFELMGNPGGVFSDFNDDAQLHRWRDLVAALARHCIERYGRGEILSWYFEAWNEPDGGWWPQWRTDVNAFCNYYDACSEGLKDADPAIVFGGPGTCMHLSDLLKAILAHCDTGRNYFTGERGVRMEFISVHEKGARSCREDLNPSSERIWRNELDIIRYIRLHHPRLARLPFMNNECDPQVGWNDFHTWRARPYYAAFVCKVINQHLVELVDKRRVDYRLLSNDNGFLGRWGHRTLLARFGDDSKIESGQASHLERKAWSGTMVELPPCELIKKPVLNAMTMLALLGNRRCDVRGCGGSDAEIGAIATRADDGQIAVLIYNSRDRIMSSGCESIELELRGVPFSRGMLAQYRIDDGHSDPYAVWEANGAPDRPSVQVYHAMRRRQELELYERPREMRAANGRVTLRFDLPLPSVHLVLFTPKPDGPPAAVAGVRVVEYRGLGGQREVMVLWQGVPSKAVRTYEILAASSARGPYRRVNKADVVCTAYLDVFEATEAPRYYKVRAADFWGRKGGAAAAVRADAR
ncbi:hypothetical protein GX586_11610 [bacterium]|nr:hypothetical protein [bacterium]